MEPSVQRDIQKSENTLFGRTIKAMAGFCIWMISALFTGIIIEIVGMHTLWKDEWVAHSERMLEYDMQYIQKSVIEGYITKEYSVLVYKAYTMTHELLSHPNVSMQALFQTSSGVNDQLVLFARDAEHVMKPYIIAAINTTKDFFVRFTILTLSLPIYFIYGIVGVVVGLKERDLRKWGGGRESNTRFDMAVNASGTSFIAPWFIYLSLPLSIPPYLIVVPCSMMFGYSIKVLCERTKKYF